MNRDFKGRRRGGGGGGGGRGRGGGGGGGDVRWWEDEMLVLACGHDGGLRWCWLLLHFGGRILQFKVLNGNCLVVSTVN